MHLENEYVHVATNTRKALHDMAIADLELQYLEGKRLVAAAHLERARDGKFGIDYVSST